MPTLHAILRDGRHWDRVDWKGLEPTTDGVLVLSRLPNSPFEIAGTLATHRLDAGASGIWQRIVVEADVPENSRLRVQYFSSDGDEPADEGWYTAPSLDTLVYPENGANPGRYLWLRVYLASTDRQTSPRLMQVRAEAGEMRYLQYLPALYERESRDDAFFRQWLALFEAEHRDLERRLDTMSYRFEPHTAPADHLAYLASWLAFEPPVHLDEEGLRSLLPKVFELYQKRGTPAGLIAWIRLYTGIRVHIHESFRNRAFWQLGGGSMLGFGTRLPAIDPAGFVVADTKNVGGGWSEPDGLVVGDAVVGHSGPLEAADMGETLFWETAHHFCITAAACEVEDPAKREVLLSIVDREKPAHTGYGLNLVGAAMRIGYQSCIGVDSIVAGPAKAMRLDEAYAGMDSVLVESEDESRIGRQARVGKNTVVS